MKTQKRKRKHGKRILALLMAGALLSTNFYGTTAYASSVQNDLVDGMGKLQAEASDTISYEYDDFDIQYIRKSIDNSADNIYITITNKSETTIENWTLQTDISGMISELYNATLTETDGMKCFKNAGYNQDILPGGSVEFGFHLQYDSDKINPSVFEIFSSQNEIEETNVTLEHEKTNEWNGGYVAEIRLTNQGETTIEDWILIVRSENVITNLWGGSLEVMDGKYCVIKNPSYNQNIEPGETVIIGYQGVGEFHSDFIQGRVSTGENLEQELQELEKEESEQAQESKETESSEETKESEETSEAEETEETKESEESTEETSVEESETE